MGNAGVTTRNERATEGLGSIGEGSELRHTSETAGEVVAERPVAVGVAEVSLRLDRLLPVFIWSDCWTLRTRLELGF